VLLSRLPKIGRQALVEVEKGFERLAALDQIGSVARPKLFDLGSGHRRFGKKQRALTTDFARDRGQQNWAVTRRLY
jgi:hypothetical protein